MKNRGAQGGGEGTAVNQRGPREEERAAYVVQDVRRRQGGGEPPPVLASPLREEERAAKVWGRTVRNVPDMGPEMPGRRRGISGIQRALREEERATVSAVSVPAGAGRRRAPAGTDITAQGGGESGELAGEGPCGTSPEWVRRCQGGGEASPGYNDRSGRRRERPYGLSVFRREQGGGELPPGLTSPPREEERVANCGGAFSSGIRCGGAREEERHRRQSQWPREEERAD
ncbi:hypothetical protein [Pseudooceanicola sp. 200-1SW]|uniref:hypothetical protein n=1 Tax=Pseudooceanicola sp. 200-1SW TaxID=3425949 RepID=UPI003D7F258D